MESLDILKDDIMRFSRGIIWNMSKHPHDARAFAYSGMLFFIMNDLPIAQQLFGNSLNLDRTQKDVRAMLALTLHRRGFKKEAKALLVNDPLDQADTLFSRRVLLQSLAGLRLLARANARRKKELFKFRSSLGHN